MISDPVSGSDGSISGGMAQPSRVPASAQVDIHPNLEARVRAHLSNPWQQPIHAHTQHAFEKVSAQIQQSPKPIILDSGCGTGWASMYLANHHPDHWVVGIDRSIDRLERAPKLPTNVCLVRAELGDFWRLVTQADWPVVTHYVLYPNPYPKARHLKRRWHGHPAWPHLLMVGERLVMRTNSKLYALEWAEALRVSEQRKIVHSNITHSNINHHSFNGGEGMERPMSAFEKKYAASGHALFEVTSQRVAVNVATR